MTLDAGPMCPYCFKRGIHLATCLMVSVTEDWAARVATTQPLPKDKP